MDIVRALIAIAMILFGLLSFPYPREDRHKVGLGLGCVSLVVAGVLAMLLTSWWALLGGIALGFGIPLIHLSLTARESRIPKLPRQNMEDMSSQEIVSWLGKQREWRVLAPPVLELLAHRLQGVSFSGFYFLCRASNIDVGAIIGDCSIPELAVSMLAMNLHLTGSNILHQWTSEPTVPGQPDKNELKEWAKIAYESAIALEPYYIPSYANLATVYLMTEQDVQRADEYLRKGMALLKEIHSSDPSLPPERRRYLREILPEGEIRQLLTDARQLLADFT